MRLIQCKAYGCENRRKHHEDSEPRGPQFVNVPDEYTGDIAFCSMECAIYGGAFKKKDVEVKQV
jgi:hypothetical protein